MSDINLTDQRPRKPVTQVPESMRPIKKLPPDPRLQALIAELKAKFAKRVAEGKSR